MITLKCDVCGEQVKPAKDEARANINLGQHKRSKHSIKGMTSRERYYVYAKKMTIEQARAAIAAKDGGNPPVPRAVKPRSEVVPAALTQCCVCGSRFYVAKGSNENQY